MKNNITLEDVKFFNLKTIVDIDGNLIPIESGIDISFEIKRVFYLYDIPGGEDRGAHAHKQCQQFLIAGSGSFNVLVDDGNNKRTFSLNRPYYGLYIPSGIWAAEIGFSSGSICIVLTSHKYDEKDYIRDYQEYREYVG